MTATTLGSGIITSSLTTVGTLGSGGISSEFGAIDIGSSALSAGAGTLTSLSISGAITSTHTATSTFSRNISLSNLLVGATLEIPFLTSTTSATSTFAGGILTTDLDITNLTAGSILFTSGSAVTEDNANFFFDDTNNRLGIGTSSPLADIHLEATDPQFIFYESDAAATNKVFRVQYNGAQLDFQARNDTNSGSADGGTIMTLDRDGNVGIGTTTPAYKLHVIGDIAATGFINISTKALKTNISYLNDADDTDILTKLKEIKIARYRYTIEDQNNPLRLGLIAEESPVEILSVSGDGVDIYKLSTFTLAGVQALASKFTDLEIRLSDIESQLASAGSSGGVSIHSVIDYLASLGTIITDGIAKFANIIVENLTVGSTEKPSGITLYDEQTGEPYCIRVSGGVLIPTAGECSVIPSTTTSTTTSTTGDIETDTESPVITIVGNNPATIDVGTNYVDLGATVTDNVNDNLGISYQVNGNDVTSISIDATTDSTHTITYSATDQSGNIGTAERIVIVGTGEAATTTDTTTTTTETIDTTPPTITLIGAATLSIEQDTTYTDEGATASDDTDGDITENIITLNSVDTATLGEYTVTYNVSDQAGNSAIEVFRTITVASTTQTQ